MSTHANAGSDPGHFHMADVRSKRPTRRRAVACGEFYPGPLAFPLIIERRLPKGDALTMAEIAGLQGAKQAAALIPLCHPLTLDLVEVRCLPVAERHCIRAYCEVATTARTGVEMEALAGSSAALLTLYDLTKPVEPALTMGAIRLLFKEGGKRGLWIHPDGMSASEHEQYQPRGPARLDGIRTAVLTLSDRAHQGRYADASGPLLVEALEALGAEVVDTRVMPDDAEALAAQLRQFPAQDIRLVLCTGGTGLGPRDRTPEALAMLGGCRVPGIGEYFRSESSQHTPLACLSRADAVQLGEMLVIALPGSPRAVQQGMAILAPILAHAVAMAEGEGHP